MQPKIKKLLLSFFGKYDHQIFERGKTILHPNGEKIFFLTKGTVKMSSFIKDIHLTLNTYKSPSLFPMSLVVNNKQDRFIYSALSESEGFFAPSAEFREFLYKNPIILFDLIKRIYHGLEGFFMIWEMQLLGDAYLKVVTQLLIHSKRFGSQSKDRMIFDWHLTHQQLASQTGLARESVTREIKKLQNKSLIGYLGKKLFVKNITKLEEEYFFYLHN